MRKSTIFLTSLAMEVGVLGLLLGRAASVATAEHTRLRHEAELVATLGLSDLCLFTEARYTRHLSQADLSTAFQDHPLSLDHFPSGSLVPPPARQSGSLVPAPRRHSASLVRPPARR